MRFFASCAKGLEYLLVDELRALGAAEVGEKLAGVRFEGGLEVAYRALLWSRLASRIVAPIGEGEVRTGDDLHRLSRHTRWLDHLGPGQTFAVRFLGGSDEVRHPAYGAQRVKDGVVDHLRDAGRGRPEVDLEDPDLLIQARLHKGRLSLGIDLSGRPLHARGYRLRIGEAPLKESLAAAMLLRAGWPARGEAGETLIDPMCGSGTLPIEAAWMAADVAPGLLRWGPGGHFGCERGWRPHEPELLLRLRREAVERARAGKAALKAKGAPLLLGSDRDKAAIVASRANAESARVGSLIRFEVCAVRDLDRPSGDRPGLLIANPPYGRRLGAEVRAYEELGEKVKGDLQGYAAALLTDRADLARATGLRAKKRYALRNGALDCTLYLFEPIREG